MRENTEEKYSLIKIIGFAFVVAALFNLFLFFSLRDNTSKPSEINESPPEENSFSISMGDIDFSDDDDYMYSIDSLEGELVELVMEAEEIARGMFERNAADGAPFASVTDRVGEFYSTEYLKVLEDLYSSDEVLSELDEIFPFYASAFNTRIAYRSDDEDEVHLEFAHGSELILDKYFTYVLKKMNGNWVIDDLLVRDAE